MTGELWSLPAAEQAAGVRRGDWSAVELTDAVLDRIATVDGGLNAYCTVDADGARRAARRADEVRAGSTGRGPLHGVPFSVKDLIPTAGMRTTLGSLAHRDWVPDTDEIAVARLRAAGAVLVGKTNTRELGYGVVTDNELFGPTRNPWDPRLTAAGSSGGAAAAVAAGMGSVALGSDGGGSLRVPAAVCGVVAVKPTFGVVPLYPSCRVPLRIGLDTWESLECLGPITRTVDDAALVLSVLAGFDARDRHSVPGGSPPSPPVVPGAVAVAFSPDLGIAEVDPEVAALAEAAAEQLAATAGAELRRTVPALPPLTALRATFSATVAMDTDLSALAALAASVPVSPDIRELLARSWTPAGFGAARVARRRLYDVLHGFFAAGVDVLVTPSTATTAFPVGLRHPPDGFGGIVDGRQWSPFAFLANLTGQPAVSLPAGRTRAGLPVGIQLLGPRFSEPVLLEVARRYEAAVSWPAAF